MEELLRAYAKKRREQAEPALQMHPATRKLLHDEVKRTFAAKPASQSWRVWRWPLLAMWGGMAVLLVMFAMLNAQFRSMETGERKEEGRRMKDESESDTYCVCSTRKNRDVEFVVLRPLNVRFVEVARLVAIEIQLPDDDKSPVDWM